ncbi:aquaporin-5 [Colossoma macropomum]|uniref:aquaporin-5 n=1 Tax=Colossoma macropomum TaxID=42526 RepID=UPI0018647DAB|nr:aquaporin-5 [Colossoma macropomum]
MKLWSTFGLILKDMWSISFLRDVFREFVGTTLFLFTSLSSVVLWPHFGSQSWDTITADPLVTMESLHECTPDPLHVSLAFGASVALTCVCLGGVHLNPAVTLALVAGLRVSPWQAVLYVGAQLLGALTACSLLLGIAPASLRSNLGINELASGVHLYQAFSVEMAVTFQLVLSVLTVTHPKSAFLSLAPAVLGLSVTLGHLIAIGFTGCGMNPARSFGPAVLTMNFENHWVYWAGPCVGAMLAWLLYDLLLYPRWTSLSDWLVEFRQVFLTAPSKQPRSPESNTEI